jgi:hypothetical protein
MTKDEATALLEGLVERLATIEHDLWSHWQQYMHSKGVKQPDGSMLLPAELVARWEKQIATSYDWLQETEKESDREQVRKYLPVIADAISSKP